MIALNRKLYIIINYDIKFMNKINKKKRKNQLMEIKKIFNLIVKGYKIIDINLFFNN